MLDIGEVYVGTLYAIELEGCTVAQVEWGSDEPELNGKSWILLDRDRSSGCDLF